MRLAAASYLLVILTTYLVLGGFSAASLLACVGLGVMLVLGLLAVARGKRKWVSVA